MSWLIIWSILLVFGLVGAGSMYMDQRWPGVIPDQVDDWLENWLYMPSAVCFFVGLIGALSTLFGMLATAVVMVILSVLAKRQGKKAKGPDVDALPWTILCAVTSITGLGLFFADLIIRLYFS